ncbi:hypothetical protein [Exiguobacterium sp. s36]|uniref:hypothetical protein n=1 Tax=Exiguobacterium sp. s36 TaxID=2751227 RepID=UPI001BE9C334|nr:hypothetical protein [Exiguobacterium sp. s36]
MSVDWYYALNIILMLTAGIAFMARSYFIKKVIEGDESVYQHKQNKRRAHQSSIILAAGVLGILILIGATSLQEDDPAVETATDQTETMILADGEYGPGTYKVGTDIDAGEYKLTAADEDYHGYYEVKTDSSADGDMVGNSMFETTEYVSVEDGQYLIVKRATFAMSKEATVAEPKETDKDSILEPTDDTVDAFFDTPEQEAEFFKAIALTVEQGRETIQLASALTRTCGKLCPDVPGEEWVLQLESANNEMFGLQRSLNDFAIDLRVIPVGSSENIDFTQRDELASEFERVSELITPIMLKEDWATWDDANAAVDEAITLMQNMRAEDVYTVPNQQ